MDKEQATYLTEHMCDDCSGCGTPGNDCCDNHWDRMNARITEHYHTVPVGGMGPDFDRDLFFEKFILKEYMRLGLDSKRGMVKA